MNTDVSFFKTCLGDLFQKYQRLRTDRLSYIYTVMMRTHVMDQLNILTAERKIFSCSDKIFSSRSEFTILKGIT